MHSRIIDIDYYLPKKFSVKKIFEKNNWNFDNTFQKTGIKFIRRSDQNTTALDLALKASSKIAKKNRKKIDTIIYITQSPEYNLPSGSCIIQNRLNLSKKVMTLDINQGCSGFVYGLNLASALINNGTAKSILLICSDTYTKYIDKKDKTCLPIFSDGASCTLINRSKNQKILKFNFGTDGEGYKDLIVENSGSNLNKSKSTKIFMDGRKVLMFTMSNIPTLIKDILKKNKISINDIDHFIFHQASKTVLENLIRKLKIDKKKVFVNIVNIGNTVSSTIPIAFKQLIMKKKLKKNSLVLIAGFGVGYSMGATIIKC